MSGEPESETPAGALLGIVGGIVFALGVGILFQVFVGFHQRQATALERIASAMERSTTPAVPSPADGTLDVTGEASPMGAFPMIFEDSAGSDLCRIVESDEGTRIEGPDPRPCEQFLWARYGEIDSAPDL